MRAMLSTEPGGPETLTLTETETPEPGRGEVRIRVRAAGLNFPDTLIIRDLYQLKPRRPFSPGGEVAGEIDAVGEGVEGLRIGTRVLAVTGFGGFASHVVTGATKVSPIPDEMSFEDAACFVFTYGTSYHALADRAKMQAGETLLVLGAAGGVGVAAIEIAKSAGLRVIAAVSSEDKATFCREVGADDSIVYPREMDRDAQKAFSGQIKELSGGGVDIVYDAVGGDYAEPALRALAWQGRFLVVGFPAGIPKIPLNLTLLKGCQIVGVFWGDSVRRDPQGHAANMTALYDLAKEGKVRPRITHRLPLERAGEALELMQSRQVMGKVVLNVD